MNEKKNNEKLLIRKFSLELFYLTIFPSYFENYFQNSIQNKALKNGFLNFQVYNIRDFARNKKVDDYQYGGGNGMVMKIEPLVKLIRKVKEQKPDTYTVLLNPQGKVFNQSDVQRLIEKKKIMFICGHYEGVDCRISNYVDEEISIGEFITMGGEVPSLVISEALIRAIPGVIKEDSFKNETFSDIEFDYDAYTRPQEFEGLKVPDVLLSGNHKEIEKWRKKNSSEKLKK